MANRLPVDSDLIGYWGFDEALESDQAIDASENVFHLTVTASPSVVPGRVGNARSFDGSTSYAVAPASPTLNTIGDLTLIVWAKLTQYNGAGSQLRSILSCGGPTTSDAILYSLVVTLSGALSYRHTSASGEVAVSTAPGTFKTGQVYNVVVRRFANGPNQDVEIYLDNVLMPTTTTVNGVPQALPVPPPTANANAVLSFGRSQKETNSAFWYGFIDEASVHKVARAVQPYLLRAYFGAAIRNATTKMSVMGTAVALSSHDMGSGVRWWCLERDGDLYVVMESPFGQFGAETQLTTVGGGDASLSGKPELFYDKTTDTLYVFFVAGNRIYKLTALSTDLPGTINMPYTADTGSIIKSVDNIDAGRLGDGGSGGRDQIVSDITYVNRQPIKIAGEDLPYYNFGDGGSQEPVVTIGTSMAPTIAFSTVPGLGFGVVVGPVSPSNGGFIVYRIDGHSYTALGTPSLIDESLYFVPVSPRTYGRMYIAETLTADGRRTGFFSNTIVDKLYEPRLEGSTWRYGEEGNLTDSGELGDGGAQHAPTDYTYVNRTPIKFSGQDDSPYPVGDGGGQAGSVTQGSTTVML